ncbi:Ger(x)C family spore germination protein [Paenibacillus melissococcoides]|uniref:Ger(X)C family spore germination protein n=1 Tax=Paenibacillus melissococcoides TaxID=2912268 RepID=A0ABM9GBH6_9BACL|nr:MULTISPECIES: Ger(x)C family spore germination protein [Paenibacillus]MEB9894998.1 Ger(x)C family spore germination protein [Bacillus cereus]GIO78993.1 hypothetical protein J6TS7_26030 [Paenibacillus dendritiformis]CAH8249518.1 Ger(x)C family spore germination protein [Paenibacillus melissococcoides]CAH8721147.1 Ger(x)C family spore germination protein [Paenibacillus melissococcoides]
MKKSYRYKIFIVFSFFTLLCGCWDIKEINHQTLPLVIAISMENDEEYKLTVQIPITNNESNLSRIVTEEGNSVSSVLGQIQTNSEKAVNYSQIQLIVIHNNLAKNKQELRRLITFLMNSKVISSRALLAITDDNIEKVLTSINDKLGARASSISDYFNKGVDWAPEISRARIWEAYQSLFSYTKDIAIPIIRSGKDTVLNYEGSAILNNGEFVERITPNESLLINLFQKQTSKGKVENVGSASIVITDSSIQTKTSMRNNKPLVLRDLYIKIDILERKEGMTNIQINKELERLIERRFYNTFEKAQRYNTDIFGFGQYFRSHIPYHELKKWREVFYPKLQVYFQVHVIKE